MPTLRVHDLDLHHELRGAGPPLLLLMGWRANLDWWPEALLAPLARRHRLILVDNRGAGRTGDPGGSFSIAQLADDAAALLGALGVERADVLGVSMGGMIAQELALRHPERVHRLVLVATHCGRRGRVPEGHETRRAVGRMLLRPWRIEQELVHLLFSRPMRELDPQILREFARIVARAPATRWASLKQLLAIRRFDTLDRLPGLAAPTLVVTGDADLMVAPGNSEVLARAIPGARLVQIPGGAHALLRPCAAELDRLLGDFLAAEAEAA